MTHSDLKAQAHDLDVTVWVGKNGLDAVIGETKTQLEERDLVKVKFLRSARAGSSTDKLAYELAEKTDASLIETRGNTAVLHR